MDFLKVAAGWVGRFAKDVKPQCLHRTVEANRLLTSIVPCPEFGTFRQILEALTAKQDYRAARFGLVSDTIPMSWHIKKTEIGLTHFAAHPRPPL